MNNTLQEPLEFIRHVSIEQLSSVMAEQCPVVWGDLMKLLACLTHTSLHHLGSMKQRWPPLASSSQQLRGR